MIQARAETSLARLDLVINELQALRIELNNIRICSLIEQPGKEQQQREQAGEFENH